jgi:hypothetical protein
MPEMKDLIRRYRENSLSCEDMQRLRSMLETASPEEFNNALKEDWESYNYETDADCEAQKDNILEEIHAALDLKNNRHDKKSLWNVLRNVAAILLPFFMIATFYYYIHSGSEPSLMAVATEKGERANVSLPDGSKIFLNGSSSLVYDADAFARGDRNVELSGEALFNIAKDQSHPFEVKAKGLTVTVKGTVFNLKVVPDEQDATLYLESGLVSLHSIKDNKYVSVTPGQKAVLNYANGDITIEKTGENENILAWHQKKLFFNDESLAKVLTTIGKYYGKKITIAGSSENMVDQELFTGMIPTDNLQLSIEEIERIFHIKLKIED